MTLSLLVVNGDIQGWFGLSGGEVSSLVSFQVPNAVFDGILRVLVVWAVSEGNAKEIS